MKKLLAAFAFYLIATNFAFAQQSIVGTYKVTSFTVVIDGVAKETLGKAHGYVIFTPSQFASIITSDKREFGTTAEARAALWDTVLAYAGPYKTDGDKLTVSVDTSWNESWNGTKQARTWKLQGNTLTLTTLPAPYSRDPSKIAFAVVVTERVE